MPLLLFSVCCIISKTIDYASVMLSVYATHLLAVLSERERVAVNMQGTVFTLVRLKIVPSYLQELLSHPMPEHIEALSSSSHKIISATFS